MNHNVFFFEFHFKWEREREITWKWAKSNFSLQNFLSYSFNWIEKKSSKSVGSKNDLNVNEKQPWCVRDTGKKIYRSDYVKKLYAIAVDGCAEVKISKVDSQREIVVVIFFLWKMARNVHASLGSIYMRKLLNSVVFSLCSSILNWWPFLCCIFLPLQCLRYHLILPSFFSLLRLCFGTSRCAMLIKAIRQFSYSSDNVSMQHFSILCRSCCT